MKRFLSFFGVFLIFFLSACDLMNNTTLITTSISTEPITTYAATDETTLDYITTDEVIFTVTFNVNGGVSIGSISVKSGNTIILTPTMKLGFEFGGWFINEDLSGEPLTTIMVTSDITLYAKWENSLDMVNVIFQSNGGNDISSIQVVKNTYLSFPPNPIREGYIFKGWYLEPNFITKFEPSDLVNNDITLYALWEIEPPTLVKISFDTGGGSSIDDIEIDVNTVLDDLPIPSRDRYEFMGWFIDSTKTIRFNISQPITENLILYAKWEKAKYFVFFESNGGTSIQPHEIGAGDIFLEITYTPTRDGYIFDGWYLDEELQMPFSASRINNHTTFYAKWRLSSVTITFESKGGGDFESITTSTNEVITNLPIPVRDGYTFLGWYDELIPDTLYLESITVKRSHNLIAEWAKNSVQVSFDTNGGNTIAPISAYFGEQLSYIEPAYKEGFKFKAWYLDEELTIPLETDYVVQEDITLYAAYESIKHTLSFYSHGDNVFSDIYVDDNEKIDKLPVPTRNGYDFLGWFLDSELQNEFDENTKVNSNLNLYAKWEKSEFTIIFNTNIPDFTIPSTVLTYLTELVVNPIDYSGYIFRGWYLEPNFITKFEPSDLVNNDITLYALWEIEPPTLVKISFDTGGGSSIDDIEIDVNTVLDDLPIPSRDRYEFMGWFIDSTKTIRFNISQPITENLILYAKWSGPIVYSFLVSFETNGAEPIGDVYVIENTLLNYVPIERIGYSFDGWYVDSDYQELFDFSNPVNQDYKLYSKWIVNYYNLNFETNGGDYLSEKTVAFNSPLDLSIPTKQGMDFSGWYIDENLEIKFEENNMPPNDLTLYAKWISLISDFDYVTHDDYVEITGYNGLSSEVYIPDVIYGLPVSHIASNAFLNNSVIEKVFVESNVIYIGDFAFSGAIELKELILPSSYYELGTGILNGVNQIQKLTISSELDYNLEYYFGSDDNIPEHSFVIKFANGSSEINPEIINANLKNTVIELADDMIVIDSSTFKNNAFIKHLVIPNGIESIPDYAFENMTELESIVLPNSLNTIGRSIFRGNSNLRTITTPFVGKTRTSVMKEGVLGYFFSETSYIGSTLVKQKDGSTFIDGISYYISSSLREVIITDTSTLQEGAFNNVVFLENIILPNNLLVIDRYSLSNSGIKSIDIPDSVTLIDRYAFYGSQMLQTVNFGISSSLNKVDNYAFSNCLNLRYIILPEGLITIGQEVFRYNDNLKFVYIPDSVDTVGSLSFSNLTSTIIYTGASSKKANWMEIPISLVYDIGLIETTDDFAYAISYDFYALIIDYFGKESSVVIPDYYNELQIIGIMDNSFKELLSLESVIFSVDSKVEVIGSYAFYNCENLSNFILPQDLIEINSYAFYGTALTELLVGKKVQLIDDYAFYYSELSSLIFEDESSLEIIGMNAFFGLNLIEVEIPNSVTFIGDSAFSFNEMMTSFSFETGSQIAVIPDYMLYKNSLIQEFVLPRTVQIIGYGSFAFITNLNTFTIEDNSVLVLIDNMAFAECVNLTSMIIPEFVEAINENAFNHCVSLSQITFLSLNNLFHIGKKAFYQCESLISVVLPDSVEVINSQAFYGCSNLSSINIPNSLKVISVETFFQTALIEVFIPKSVTDILQYAFGGVSSLTILNFEENSSLTNIGQFAFTGTGITEIIIPSSVDTIGRNVISPSLEKLYFEENSNLTVIVGYTFYNNPNLSVVELPDGLLEIGYSAFGCYAPISTFGHIYNYALLSVYIPESVVTMEAQAFRNVMNLTIYTAHLSKPVGWHNDFNLRTTTTYHEVIYGANIDEEGNYIP